MKKILLVFSVALLIFSSMIRPVYADEEHKTATFDVFFDGNEFTIDETKYASVAELEELIKEALNWMEPGDDATITINLINKSGKTVNWYMNNTSEPFEQDSAASDAMYEYDVIVSGKAEPIFSSEYVGGEGGNGVADATETLNGEGEYFFVDQLSPNGQGHVSLYLALDGETQNNSYQETLSKLIVKFAAEIQPDPERKEEHIQRVVYIPYTGDDSNINFYIISEIIALLLLAVVLYLYYRYRKNSRMGA